MAFGMSADEQRKWMSQNLPLVQERLAEPVVAYAAFQRGSAYGRMAVAKVSPIASILMGAAAKKKSGGLPSSFLLVLTPTHLHALAFKFRGRGMKVGDELAVWERAAIRTSVEAKSLTMGLTIEAPGEEERVACEATKSAVTDDFLAALGSAQPVA